MKRLYILIIFFLLGKLTFLNAQCSVVTPDQNLNKYWEWRERLKNFVMPGTCWGCSMPADNRSHGMTWDDAPEQLGYYIGVLATEWYLLGPASITDTASAHQRTRDVAELYYAVNQVYMLDMMAKASWHHYYNHVSGFGYSTGDLDGFLIRDNVPLHFPDTVINSDYVENNLNKSLAPVPDGILYDNKIISSNWTGQGQTGQFSKNPLVPCHAENGDSGGAPVISQDELSQLYIGFALVAKYIPSSLMYNGQSILAISNTEENRIYTLTGGTTIHNTVTHACGTGGAWTDYFTFAMSLFDQCKCNVGGSEMGGAPFTIGKDGIAGADFSINSPTPFCPTCWSLALTPRWLGIYPNFYIGYENEYIMLCFGTIGNVWGASTPWVINKLAIKQANQPNPNKFPSNCDIYPILYEALWGVKVGTSYSTSFYNLLLTSAPCHGIQPYDNNYNWGKGNRVDVGSGANPYSAVYHGLDYLLFFNLFQLAYPVINGSGSYVTYQYVHPKDLRFSYLIKTNVDSEHNEKNFWATDSIKAGDTSHVYPSVRRYIIANDNDPNETLFQGRAQISFRAGHKIDLIYGFEAKPGVLFDATIDTSIHTMNCIDCAGNLNVDSLYLPNDTSRYGNINYFRTDTIKSTECICQTYFPFGINGDTAGIKSWYWDFGNGQTSTVYNPSVTYCPAKLVDSVSGWRDTAYQMVLIVKDSLDHYDTLEALIYFRCGESFHSPIKPNTQKTQDSLKNTATLTLLPSITENLSTVQYYIPQQVSVNINVYSMMGFKMETLINNITEAAGNYSLPINVSSFQPGMYFINIQAGDFIQTKKLVVVRKQE